MTTADDDFPQFRVNESTSKEPFNEFDHYIGMPPLSQKIRPLQYWKKESPTSPKLRNDWQGHIWQSQQPEQEWRSQFK